MSQEKNAALIAEIVAQRNLALDRCVLLAIELDAARKELAAIAAVKPAPIVVVEE